MNIVLRIFSVFVLFLIYIGLMWFLDYRTNLEKIIGFSSIALGALTILTPVKIIGEKKWHLATYIFYALSGSLILLIKSV